VSKRLELLRDLRTDRVVSLCVHKLQ
jgi:hypothetical protein